MSAIIKKQYETAKQLLKSVEECFSVYQILRGSHHFDHFFNMSKYLLAIIGDVEVCTTVVLQGKKDEGLTLIEDCRQKFAAYEAELKTLGLIDNKPKMKNEDLYTLERMERMQEERDAMYFERGYDYGC